MKKIIILLLLAGKWAAAQDCLRQLGGGACIVMENDKYGIKKKGKYIVPTQFDQLADHSGRFFSVQQNGKWGIFSISGQIVLPVAYASVTAIDAQAGLMTASGNGYNNSLVLTENIVWPKSSVKGNPFLMVSPYEVTLGQYMSFVMDLQNNPVNDFTYDMALPDSMKMAPNTRRIYHAWMSHLNDECTTRYEAFDGKPKCPVELPCHVFDKKNLYLQLELPVNGITLEQARQYCTWLSGKLNAEHTTDLPYEMVVRLPRPAEWEDIALGGLHESMKPRMCLDSMNAKACILFNYQFNRQACTHTEIQIQKYGNNVVPVDSYNPDFHGTFCLFGNVAEMTSDEGIAKGGSYLQFAADCKTDRVQKYEGAAPWLGFRWVIEYRMKP